VAGADIERLIREVNFHPAGGLLATPAVDTLKSGDSDSRVSGTVSRNGLWRAQTPQLFPVSTLIEAIDHCHDRGEPCTDEAQAIEALGLKPKLVTCGNYNFKVTHPSDMVIASAILKEQEAALCTE
jgi:2-C-methyl-D-erythritol 4-phosphate cytidylyltransferase